MSGFQYEELLFIVAFLAVIWFMEKFVEMLGVSKLIGAIFAGIICGPNVLDFVPWWCDAHEDHTCGVTPFVMLGQIGVTFMIAESGTHFDYDKVKKVIKGAFGVAVLGTFVPLVAGMLLFNALGFPLYPDGFAAGASLAPTSVGIAIKLLTENKQLNSIPGQTIVTAAFIDDVFSLVVLVVLMKLAAGSVTPWALCQPFIFSFVFLGLAMWATIKVWPYVIGKCILGRIKERRHLSHQPRDMVHLSLMLLFLVFMGWLGAIIGSHLLGAFAAGMSFSGIPRSHYVWGRQMKRISAWCVRMFFAATVGFVIPVSTMFSLDSFWKGLVIAIGPTIIGKVIAGLHTGEYRWVIGFAMVGRGEFAYLVAESSKSTCYLGAAQTASNQEENHNEDEQAQEEEGNQEDEQNAEEVEANPAENGTARRLDAVDLLMGEATVYDLIDRAAAVYDPQSGGERRRSVGDQYDVENVHQGTKCETFMLSPEGFSVVVWALLLATIVAPNAFAWVLKKAFAGKPRSGIEQFLIKAEGPHHTGMYFEIADVLHSLHLDVVEAKTESDGHTVFGTWLVQTTDLADELDKDKIHEIEHMIKEAVNSPDTQISCSLGMHALTKGAGTPGQTPHKADAFSPSKLKLDKKLINRQGGRSAPLSPVKRAEMKTEKDTWLEIRIMAMHDKSIVTEVLETLDRIGLHVMKAHTEEHHEHEEEVFYAKNMSSGTITREQARTALKALFHKHGMKAQIMVKRVNALDVVTCQEKISKTTTNVVSLKTMGMLDDLEEGYEITIEVDHAERDPHLVAHIARALTDKRLDVTSFDMAEMESGEHARTKLSLFVRRNVSKEPDKRTQKIIKATIKQYLKQYNLEVRTLRITAVTADEARMLVEKVCTEGNLVDINEEVLRTQVKLGTTTCLTPSPKRRAKKWTFPKAGGEQGKRLGGEAIEMGGVKKDEAENLLPKHGEKSDAELAAEALNGGGDDQTAPRGANVV